jgi:hypothetical protein
MNEVTLKEEVRVRGEVKKEDSKAFQSIVKVGLMFVNLIKIFDYFQKPRFYLLCSSLRDVLYKNTSFKA